MPILKPWKLPPVDQIQYAVDQWPEEQQMARLAYAEQKAKERGDTEVLQAIARWRLRQQLQGAGLKTWRHS